MKRAPTDLEETGNAKRAAVDPSSSEGNVAGTPVPVGIPATASATAPTTSTGPGEAQASTNTSTTETGGSDIAKVASTSAKEGGAASTTTTTAPEKKTPPSTLASGENPLIAAAATGVSGSGDSTGSTGRVVDSENPNGKEDDGNKSGEGSSKAENGEEKSGNKADKATELNKKAAGASAQAAAAATAAAQSGKGSAAAAKKPSADAESKAVKVEKQKTVAAAPAPGGAMLGATMDNLAKGNNVGLGQSALGAGLLGTGTSVAAAAAAAAAAPGGARMFTQPMGQPINVGAGLAGGPTGALQQDGPRLAAVQPAGGMGGGAAAAAAAAGGKQLGVEDALAYLDKVKKQFHDKPKVYEQFLEIMKNFKSQTIDTPGVINHVCDLFKGYDNLILGFNTFLPPGFKIELPPNRGLPTVGGRPIVPGSMRMGGMPGQVPGGLGGAPAQRGKGGRGRGGRAGGKGGMGRADSASMLPTGIPEDSAATASAHGQPREFNHAIEYVTQIKKRFATDTDTYKQFLDILHSYQNEQRSITEVLDQVSTLFKDHPDLLQRFTYFLPETVRDSELVRRATKGGRGGRGKVGGKKRDRKSSPLADFDHDENRVPQMERNLLGRIKAALGTRELWGEFLKCLDLFAQELISRAELLSLISDIFGDRADLLEEFDRLLASRGATDDPVESAWFSMPLTDIDFSNCRRCTPSYRGLPAAYPKAPCSERTALCRSVLNDTWVSVPLGSEDSSSKNHRRNIFEEALFKCEDDRYEIDMIIDSNKAAIRALEPLAREIETLSLEDGNSAKFRYRLERRTLSVIHLKAIARIYGDHGTEILELLHRNPGGAIPIILKRLKEKDAEWCKDRQELNKQWKEAMEKNYLKSLDHRSFYFKQAEKRNFTAKVLLAELKEKARVASANAEKKKAEAAAAEGGAKEGAEGKMDVDEQPAATEEVHASPHLFMNFTDPTVHQDVWSIIALKVAKISEAKEAEQIAAFYTYFILPLLQLPKKWVKTGQSLLSSLNIIDEEDESKRPKTREEAFSDGTRVFTSFGTGTVKGYDVNRSFYEIDLGFGRGWLRPSAVSLTRAGVNARAITMVDPEATKEATRSNEGVPELFITTHVYVFLAQYHLLYDRLRTAKELCETIEKPVRVKHTIDRAHEADAANSMQVDEQQKDSSAAANIVASGAKGETDYSNLLSLMLCLVNGQIEPSKFEDECRNLIGADVFFLNTVDRLANAIQRQLALIVSDNKAHDCIQYVEKFVAKSSEARKNRALNLANLYQTCTSHLMMQPDQMCVKIRFEPGVLKTSDDEEGVDENGLTSKDKLPFPTGSKIVKPPVRKQSIWNSAPKLAVTLIETLPLLRETGKKSIPVPSPLHISYTKKVSLDHMCNLQFGGKGPSKYKEEAGKMHFTMPAYRFAEVDSNADIEKAITDNDPSLNESSGSGFGRKSRPDSWFAALLMNANSGDSGADSGSQQVNGEPGDVDMKG